MKNAVIVKDYTKLISLLDEKDEENKYKDSILGMLNMYGLFNLIIEKEDDLALKYIIKYQYGVIEMAFNKDTSERHEENPLVFICSTHKYTNCLSQLLSNKDLYKQTDLLLQSTIFSCTKNNNSEIFEYLLQYGLDLFYRPNFPPYLSIADIIDIKFKYDPNNHFQHIFINFILNQKRINKLLSFYFINPITIMIQEYLVYVPINNNTTIPKLDIQILSNKLKEDSMLEKFNFLDSLKIYPDHNTNLTNLEIMINDIKNI